MNVSQRVSDVEVQLRNQKVFLMIFYVFSVRRGMQKNHIEKQIKENQVLT